VLATHATYFNGQYLRLRILVIIALVFGDFDAFLPSYPLPDRTSRTRQLYTVLIFIADSSELPGTSQSERFALVVATSVSTTTPTNPPPPPCLHDWHLPWLTHQPPPLLQQSETRSEALAQVPGTCGGIGSFFLGR
jgi:phage shock protein PspC (stress-responsive transcriptional regulator)